MLALLVLLVSLVFNDIVGIITPIVSLLVLIASITLLVSILLLVLGPGAHVFRDGPRPGVVRQGMLIALRDGPRPGLIRQAMPMP